MPFLGKNLDWWLGRTPEQQDKKASARQQLHSLQADRADSRGEKAEKRALKMSKKRGRGGRRARKAALRAELERSKAEHLRDR